MTKLNKKLIARISLVFILVSLFSYGVNTFFLPQYLLYQKKHELAALTEQILKMDTSQVLQEAQGIEEKYGVTIVYAPSAENIDHLNQIISDKLSKKGITLSKFWITEESIAKLNENNMVRKIYNQEKLKSSFLVTFMKKDAYLLVIGESISHSTDTLAIVNQFNVYLYIGGLLLLILLSGLFTKQIVRPLTQIQEAAEGISKLSFTKVHIHTGDEIESLALSINQMSEKLEQAHRELEHKNQNLRDFIANISHELKTPLALIKAYTSGIKDGLDDGTYLDVIGQQTDDISGLVSKLLELSKLQTDHYQMNSFDFQALLHKIKEKHRISVQQQHIQISLNDSLLTDSWVFADEQKIEMVLNNLISNAIKYTTNGNIRMVMGNREGQMYFSIANGVELAEPMKWDQVWEPFYVMESSRSKQLSGTGLGLSIVRTILQKHGSQFGLNVQNGEIEFYFTLPIHTKEQ
ncbi:HAMP domain-containing histidine kinase [Paenibacillus alba]|uniref:sensor histidine kinase n=1 Tax=Paenibacillus alba TaxID=1197127 RepID=UPI0015631D39|nr:HAMP domain-containing sensor histidine kinase [Paenibacillus alba]NQX69982.1 HAMP domain-containing histidine kinase [Paenibacillus alba]